MSQFELLLENRKLKEENENLRKELEAAHTTEKALRRDIETSHAVACIEVANENQDLRKQLEEVQVSLATTRETIKRMMAGEEYQLNIYNEHKEEISSLREKLAAAEAESEKRRQDRIALMQAAQADLSREREKNEQLRFENTNLRTNLKFYEDKASRLEFPDTTGQ